MTKDEYERGLAMAVARGVTDVLEHAMKQYRMEFPVVMAGVLTGSAQLVQRKLGVSYSEALGKLIEAAEQMREEAVRLEGRMTKGGSG